MTISYSFFRKPLYVFGFIIAGVINSYPALAQQCTLPSHIFLPNADNQLWEQLGRSIDVDGQYMVAGLQENCSQQVYSGIAFVYKINPENKWEKIAELSPSNPGKYRIFGTKVVMSGSTIVVMAEEYSQEGWTKMSLYVFEKPTSGELASHNRVVQN